MNDKYFNTVAAKNKYNLDIPMDALLFIKESPERVNGCGREGSLVPNTIFGVSVCHACYVHDAEWAILRDKKSNYTLADMRKELMRASARFTRNMKKITDYESHNKFTAWIRRYRIATYSSAVDLVGTKQELESMGYEV